MAKSHGWRETGRMPMEGITAVAYQKGPCRVLISQEPHGAKMRWHMSISVEDRYPGWEEIKDARYNLLPLGLTFAQILPPPGDYVNVHRNCFHLWEIDEHEW